MKTSWDGLAVRVMLGSGSLKAKQAQLAQLAKRAKDQLENRVECPECGHKGPHDDNGQTGVHLSYCCCNCGAHFDSEEM